MLSPSDPQGIQHIKTLIQGLSELPDAIICQSDLQAIQLCNALKEMNVRIPEQVAIVGCDNLPETQRQSPQLTTIDGNTFYQGQLAAKKILERIANPEKPHEYILCETRLIYRSTS